MSGFFFEGMLIYGKKINLLVPKENHDVYQLQKEPGFYILLYSDGMCPPDDAIPCRYRGDN